jgi:hypothetical protein
MRTIEPVIWTRTLIKGILDSRKSGDNPLEMESDHTGEHQELLRLTAGLVTLSSCIGTLKSTRMRTFLPLTSTSVMESLLDNDMVDNLGASWQRPEISRVQ